MPGKRDFSAGSASCFLPSQHSCWCGLRPATTGALMLWREFSSQLRATINLSSGFPPSLTIKLNARTRWWTQLYSAWSPSSWLQQLLWVRYAHNTLTIALFQGGYGYQPPLFSALEKEAASPSAMAKPGLKLTLSLLWFVTRIATFPIRLSHRSLCLG